MGRKITNEKKKVFEGKDFFKELHELKYKKKKSYKDISENVFPEFDVNELKFICNKHADFKMFSLKMEQKESEEEEDSESESETLNDLLSKSTKKKKREDNEEKEEEIDKNDLDLISDGGPNTPERDSTFRLSTTKLLSPYSLEEPFKKKRKLNFFLPINESKEKACLVLPTQKDGKYTLDSNTNELSVITKFPVQELKDVLDSNEFKEKGHNFSLLIIQVA